MKKHFNKEIVMAKQENQDFMSSIKCWICDKVKVRDHCHITEKDRDSALKDCNVNLTLFRIEFFGAAQERGKAKRPSALPKICYIYATMMKHHAVTL